MWLLLLISSKQRRKHRHFGMLTRPWAKVRPSPCSQSQLPRQLTLALVVEVQEAADLAAEAALPQFVDAVLALPKHRRGCPHPGSTGPHLLGLAIVLHKELPVHIALHRELGQARAGLRHSCQEVLQGVGACQGWGWWKSGQSVPGMLFHRAPIPRYHEAGRDSLGSLEQPRDNP